MPATFNHVAGRFLVCAIVAVIGFEQYPSGFAVAVGCGAACGIYDVVAGYFRRFGIVAGIAVATGCIMFARYIYAG